MSDPHSGRPSRPGALEPPRRSLFQRLIELVAPRPESRDQLIDSLAEAESKELIPPEGTP